MEYFIKIHKKLTVTQINIVKVSREQKIELNLIKKII